jgi:transcriptional regulator with XRE-family HTH domain
VVPVKRFLLRDLLPQHGIPSILALCQRLGLTKQYGCMLWHGTIGLSAAMMRRLHDELGIPAEALLQVERARPAKRAGRKPRRPSPKARPQTPPAEERYG